MVIDDCEMQQSLPRRRTAACLCLCEPVILAIKGGVRSITRQDVTFAR